MRTATYNVDVASDRRRRENVPRHILCSSASGIDTAAIIDDPEEARR